MNQKAHGQIRQGQVISTYGPGALIDLPRHSAIVGGLESWGPVSRLSEIVEPRLTAKLQQITGVPAPRLYTPPVDSNDPHAPASGITAWRFPEWFVVQDVTGGDAARDRSRRLVHRKALDEKGRFDGHSVVATRFVRACPRGHVDDLDWNWFVHGHNECTRREFWLDETGTTGDLGDLRVRCACDGRSRPLSDASDRSQNALGPCSGKRPWLGSWSREPCGHPSRLLIRTASNAYFSQGVSVLALPDRGGAVGEAVQSLWDDLQVVEDAAELAIFRRKPKVAEVLAAFTDAEVIAAIKELREGSVAERPVKIVELDAILAAPVGYGDDVPVNTDFHARRLPDLAWRRSTYTDPIECVVQLHRLREVIALVGFTRFEAISADINGEYESDVERAQVADEPTWFPAVENRGEGIFLRLRADAIEDWLDRPGVQARLDALAGGFEEWATHRQSKRLFPGGPYVLLHTLSHLLIQSLSMRCGYPASSIRERVYADTTGGRYGLLLYTGSPDAEGTLGGLVEEARRLDDHLTHALHAGALCSNDPICAQHSPSDSLEERWLHGAACHGCVLVAETSCEARNDLLDRALVVPTVAEPDAAFFAVPG